MEWKSVYIVCVGGRRGDMAYRHRNETYENIADSKRLISNVRVPKCQCKSICVLMDLWYVCTICCLRLCTRTACDPAWSVNEMKFGIWCVKRMSWCEMHIEWIFVNDDDDDDGEFFSPHNENYKVYENKKSRKCEINNQWMNGVRNDKNMYMVHTHNSSTFFTENWFSTLFKTSCRLNQC